MSVWLGMGTWGIEQCGKLISLNLRIIEVLRIILINNFINSTKIFSEKECPKNPTPEHNCP